MPAQRSLGTTALVVAAYVVATFPVQALSHFVLNADHYALIPFARPVPIMPLGIFTILLQGVVLAWLYPVFHRDDAPISSALGFSWAMGLFLGSYIALTEPAKYAAPSVLSWFGVESTASAVQFTLFGILLFAVYRIRRGAERPRPR